MSQNNPQKAKFPVYPSNQPRGHQDYGQAGFPQQYGYSQALQSVQTNAGHDMNKQLQQGQPQMYANPGGMGSVPQHHHQGGMAGPSPSPQQTTLVQQSQQLGRAQMQQFPSYYRNSVPRTVQNMGRNPMSSVVNQQPQQASSQYNHMQIAVHPVGQLMQITNPQLAQMYQHQQRFPSPTQYSLISPHQTFHQPVYQNYIANAYNNGPPPNANGFYPQHQMQSYNPIQTQMPQIQPVAPAQQQLQQPPQQPRKRIPIIDPTSGKNILETVNDEAGPPKENEPADSSICIQFATQVARLANNEKSEPKSSSIEDARIVQPVVLSPSELEPENIDSLDANIGEICEPYLDPNQTIVGSHEALSYYKKDSDLPIVNNTYESKITPETVPDMEILDSKVYESMPEEPICELKEELMTDNLIHVEEISMDKPIVGYYDVPDTVEPSAPPLVTEVISPSITTQDAVVCQPSLTVDESNISPLNGDITELPATNLKSQEKQPVESKKNKTKKKKDLNKRGESKEGGDMDAFLDMKNEEVSSKTAIVSPPPVLDTAPEPPPESPPPIVETVTTPVDSPVIEERPPTPPIPTIVDSEILSTIPLPGETIEPMPNDVSPCEPLSSEVISVSPSSESEDKENVSEDSNQSKIVLKYTYKEDQWSPLNPEGKKQYDRDFLLQLQSQPMSMCKPANLPNLDVIRDKAQIQRLTEINRSAPMPSVNVRAHDPFIPNFARGGTPRPPHPAMGGRRSQQGRGGEKKTPKVINLPSSQGIKLHEAGNAWKPSVAKPRSEEENVETMELYKKVRGILNKLTPQKFETLVEQVKNFDINTEEKLNGVIDLVFEKAIDEPNFSVPYANMCKQLALIKVPIAGQPGQYVNFRKLLLTKCQKEFEQDSRDEQQREEKLKAMETASPEESKVLKMEFDMEEKKMRYRQLGNIRFIGELFKLGMLIEPIMHECIKKLLTQADEESLECLCKLLKTIGKELEEKGSNKGPGSNHIMNGYFNEMQDIVDKRRTSSRVRFMLQDVIELKRNNWIPRRDENLPKTIDQIHKEAEKEAFEQQQKVYNANMTSYPKRMPDDRRKVQGRMSEDGWTPTTKNIKGNYNTVDPSKLKFTKPEEIDGIRLGPGGGGMQRWGRGSSGGNKTPAEAEIKTPLTNTTNRYSALADQNMTPGFENRRGQQRSAASSRESSRGRNSQMPPAPIRKTPSSSRERESLIEAVKEISRTQSADAKRLEMKKTNIDGQLNGKVATETSAIALRGLSDLSEDDMDKKTKPLVDEFIHNADYEEAVKCVTELASPSTVNYFIYSAINQVLERSSQARYLLGQLFYLLVKRELITLDQYKKGLSSVLENVDDYAVDIPLIWEYMGEIIEPMVEENKLPLTFLKEVLEPCIPSLTAGKLVSAVLHCAAKKKGTIKLGELWRESFLQWTDFLDSSTDIKIFIHNQNLDFTVSPTKVVHNELSTAEIREQLKKFLESTSPDENEKVFDWIDGSIPANVTTSPSFIRALTSAIHEICIKADKTNGGKLDLDANLLKKRIPLLTRYINHNENFELQALYAIQKLVSDLGQPKGVLRSIFDCIYDEDVITEETFKQWEQSKDPNEAEGKSVALLSARGFFTWLREAEASGEDDEGE